MPKKKSFPSLPVPTSFQELISARDDSVRRIARRLRKLIQEEADGVQESFYGGKLPMSMYRTSSDLCWIQPLKSRCNLYLMFGPELEDSLGLLEGQGRNRHLKVSQWSAEIEGIVRAWLSDSIQLQQALLAEGDSFDEVLERLRGYCLRLPETKETLTWGKPHFRVREKIFCGCGETNGRPFIGLKMATAQSRKMMRLPGIEKAAYSRKDDGWVSIDPNVFDDWEEIEKAIVESYRLIAPRKILERLD